VDEQDVVIFIHPHGSGAVQFFLLRPSLPFPFTYHTIVLNHGMVFFYLSFPVFLKPPINKP
jgi:hypothetical protein